MQGKLHQYNLTRELAKKYSHVTYLASPIDPQGEHDEPEHQVILTMFNAFLFPLPHERENVLQKAQRIQELEHPHLAPILDMGIENERPFVVRKYLPHESLRSRLKTLSPDHLELRDALIIVSQVGQALAYAHKHYILHSNLKPENIFFDANGQAVLTDFSLVDRGDAILRDQTTEEYAFCYLAPEQFTGTSDARSDQYALGCLAYELISGRVPFVARSLASIMGHQNNILPAPLSESIADLSPSLDAAILKTLAKDPNERFFDFSLFLEVVQSALVLTPAFPLTNSTASRKPKINSRPMYRRPKARMHLSSAIFPSSTPEIPEAEAIQQSEERIPITTKSVSDADQRDTKLYIPPKTTNDGTRKNSMDGVRKPPVSEMPFFESLYDLDQTQSQEDTDNWFTNLFEEQESNDFPAKGSIILRHEQHEFDEDTRDNDFPAKGSVILRHEQHELDGDTRDNDFPAKGSVILRHEQHELDGDTRDNDFPAKGSVILRHEQHELDGDTRDNDFPAKGSVILRHEQHELDGDTRDNDFPAKGSVILRHEQHELDGDTRDNDFPAKGSVILRHEQHELDGDTRDNDFPAKGSVILRHEQHELDGDTRDNDFPAKGSVILRHEQHELDGDTRDKVISSLHRDRAASKRTLLNRSKVLGLVLLCFVIVASGMYTAFFLPRTSKPDKPDHLVRPTQAATQVLIPAQNSISPTQLAVTPTPTPTAAQPAPQITTIPIVAPTPTPIPSPIVRQILTVDDSVEGTGLNQFNYVGSGWSHCTGGCNGTGGDCYNGSWTLDNVANDYITVSFTGIQIKFYAVTGTYGGTGAVSLDGGSETIVNFYSVQLLGDQLMWTSPTMPAGSHTFKLRVTGTKGDPSSKDSEVGIDRVDIMN